MTAISLSESAEWRFWRKVSIGDGCWEWLSTRWNGYGKFRAGAKNLLAHRVMYELLVGPIPEGLTIDHLCRNRGCVNPGHLEPVTTAENTRRGESFSAVYGRKTHCKNGHPFSAENTRVSRGRRICRTCHRIYCREWQRTRAAQEKRGWNPE